MKLGYVTRQFPFERLGEAFLASEVQVLAGICEQIHVIPARAAGRTSVFGGLGSIDVFIPWSGVGVVLSSIAEAARHPVLAARALRCILTPHYSLSTKMKNLVLFPKALAVAAYVRRAGIDHIHAHWLTTPSTVAYVASLLTGIPWSCTGHAHDVFSDNLLHEKAGAAEFVRIISRRNFESFTSRTQHRHDDHVCVVHVGVRVPDTPAQPLADNQMLRLLCPARLHPMKGHRDLLDALAQLKGTGVPFHCDFAGDGELRAEIEARVRRLDLVDHVTLRGVVSHDRLIEEIQNGRYDAVVLSSIEDKQVTEIFEGIPVALIEAMAAGIPCVSTRVGSIPELIDSESGVLVDQHDPARLAQSLVHLAQDPAFRKRLGQAARRRVQEHFDVRSTALELYELMRPAYPLQMRIAKRENRQSLQA